MTEHDMDWACEYCGWLWPWVGEPPISAECDNCGGPLNADRPEEER